MSMNTIEQTKSFIQRQNKQIIHAHELHRYKNMDYILC